MYCSEVAPINFSLSGKYRYRILSTYNEERFSTTISVGETTSPDVLVGNDYTDLTFFDVTISPNTYNGRPVEFKG